MKTKILTFIISIVMVLAGTTSKINAQNYDNLGLDTVISLGHYDFCSAGSDGLVIHKPAGETTIEWQIVNPVQIISGGDSIIVPNTFNSQITYMGNSGAIIFYVTFENPLITPSFTDATVCGLGTTTLDAGNPGATYLWSNGSSTQTITIGGGTYSVTVSNHCGEVYHSATVTESNPNPPVLNNTTICDGSSTILNPGTFSSYVWTGGTSGTTLTVSNAGTYSVTTTDAGGCQDVASMTLTVTPPSFEHRDIHFCQGTTAQCDAGTWDNYTWSMGPFTGQIFPTPIAGTYTVTVSNNSDHCNHVIEFSTIELVPPIESLCYVDFDTLTWKNNNHWKDNLPANVDSIRVRRESTVSGVWDIIGTVPKSVNHLIDAGSSPQNQSYTYVISTIDSCGNESPISSSHTTITLLSTYNSGTDTYGFSWSHYLGLTVPTYTLYGIETNGNVTAIASVAGTLTFYNYVEPSPAYIKYFIGFDAPDCNSAKTTTLVKSNWTISTVTAIMENMWKRSITIYPNPVSNNGTLTIGGTEGITIKTIELSNMLGQAILTTESNSIALNGVAPGMYFITITADKGAIRKKITID